MKKFQFTYFKNDTNNVIEFNNSISNEIKMKNQEVFGIY